MKGRVTVAGALLVTWLALDTATEAVRAIVCSMPKGPEALAFCGETRDGSGDLASRVRRVVTLLTTDPEELAPKPPPAAPGPAPPASP